MTYLIQKRPPISVATTSVLPPKMAPPPQGCCYVPLFGDDRLAAAGDLATLQQMIPVRRAGKHLTERKYGYLKWNILRQ